MGQERFFQITVAVTFGLLVPSTVLRSQTKIDISRDSWNCSMEGVSRRPYLQPTPGVSVSPISYRETYVFEPGGTILIVRESDDPSETNFYDADDRWVETGSQVRWSRGNGSTQYRADLETENSLSGIFQSQPYQTDRGKVRCTRNAGRASSTSQTPPPPTPAEEALKEMKDPFSHKRQVATRESGLADPFAKKAAADKKIDQDSLATSQARNAEQRDAAQRAREEGARKLALTKSTWSPAEVSFDPRNPYPVVLNLIAPNGGLVLAMSISIGQVTIGQNALAKGTLTVDVVNASTCTLQLSGMLYSKGTAIKSLGNKNIGAGNRIAANGASGVFYADANSRLVFRPSGFLHDCQ